MHKIDQGNETGVMNNNAYFADNFNYDRPKLKIRGT